MNMSSITPAARSAAIAAGEGVRPIMSGWTRSLGMAAAGFGVATGLAYWADNHYSRMPDANGHSVGFMDRIEARRAFSGPTGFPAVISFSALMAVPVLYSKLRDHVNPAEFTVLKNLNYAFMGGMLVGTAAAGGLLPTLPAHQ